MNPTLSALMSLLTGGALLAVPTVSPARAESPETIFRDARQYTVRIRTQVTTPFIEDTRGSFSGAGFVIDARRGWILTNAHVVTQSPADLQVAFADGAFRPARKLHVDSFTDMAVIEVQSSGSGMRAPQLDCKQVPRVGEAVAAFGHPLGMPFTGTRGIVSGHTDRYLNDLIQMDATIDHGNSGGPVIALRDGRIVGISTAGAGGDESNRMNLATPLGDICRIIDILRDGGSPEPPQMEFSFLIDEDNRHTLRVAATHDPERWPFSPGDRILTVGEEQSPVATVTDFVTAMRGRRGPVPIQIERAEKTYALTTNPRWRSTVTARRGLLVDGALIAPLPLEDDGVLATPTELAIHSVAPGSSAEALGLAELDILISIDGRAIGDLDALSNYLARRGAAQPIRLVVRRGSSSHRRWSEFHVRDLPGEEIAPVGPEVLSAVDLD